MLGLQFELRPRFQFLLRQRFSTMRRTGLHFLRPVQQFCSFRRQLSTCRPSLQCFQLHNPKLHPLPGGIRAKSKDPALREKGDMSQQKPGGSLPVLLHGLPAGLQQCLQRTAAKLPQHERHLRSLHKVRQLHSSEINRLRIRHHKLRPIQLLREMPAVQSWIRGGPKAMRACSCQLPDLWS